MHQLFMNGYPQLNTSGEQTFINSNYATAENVSIDYAILENATNVFVLPATFDWNDLGTWGSLYDKLEKDDQNNAILNSKVIVENATNNIIRAHDKKIIIIDGLNDYIIVDEGNKLLIYPKSKEQEIKNVINKL